jgi:cytochrome o ubiquinol oxidase subunit 2
MLLVILPVYFLTFVFSWIYRADNIKAKYEPDLVDNVVAEYIWWGLPLVLTLAVAYLTYIKTHELDPYKPIVSDNKEKKIQVVALQWKWLFIYPEEKIAAINFVQFPKNTPIHFEITGDAPMNSFWIPALGGQIYAMPKMRTELYLIANEAGDFRGLSANISGEGFAGMHFIARSSSEEEFDQWVASVKENNRNLDLEEYNKLSSPSKNNQAAFYLLQEEKLFDKIIMKYMHP